MQMFCFFYLFDILYIYLFYLKILYQKIILLFM